MLVFSTQLCELLPLFPSIWFPPLPCVNKYTVQYTRILCASGVGMGFWASVRQINNSRKVRTGEFFTLRHFAMPSMSLIFRHDGVTVKFSYSAFSITTTPPPPLLPISTIKLTIH
jgi:hypothetical protein